MLNITFSFIAIALYTAAASYQGLCFFRRQPTTVAWLSLLSLAALVAHGASIAQMMMTPQGFSLTFFVVLSLVCWLVNLLVLTSGLRLPLHNLLLLLFPISILTLGLSLLASPNGHALSNMSSGLIAHILLSILAYSLMTIAAAQALLLAWQEHQLKHKHAAGRIRLLPPLQTMESLLFDVLWAGYITLTLGILSGFIFLENMFAQSLAHKTLLSLFAWCIYSVLLLGRYRLGWRGQQAIRWTLGGFVCLMLGYFGSKLVLELILGR